MKLEATVEDIRLALHIIVATVFNLSKKELDVSMDILGSEERDEAEDFGRIVLMHNTKGNNLKMYTKYHAMGSVQKCVATLYALMLEPDLKDSSDIETVVAQLRKTIYAMALEARDEGATSKSKLTLAGDYLEQFLELTDSIHYAEIKARKDTELKKEPEDK